MRKIGITGSLASGKTTASKILSAGKGPLFSADNIVKKLYANKSFQQDIRKIFKIKNKISIKIKLREIILSDKNNIIKLEKIIHPLVRKAMKKFMNKHKNKAYTFFEIPLLVESKLMKYFDIIIFIRSNRKTRLKRFKLNGGDKKLFQLLDNKQLKDDEKIKFCDHIIVNEKNKKILKKNLQYIFKKYE